MFMKICFAIVVAVAVTLGCILVGGLLVASGVALLITIGKFLKDFDYLLGLLAGAWYFFKWPR